MERERERELIKRYGLSAGQIKFYRRIFEECDFDPAKRDLDYPVTPDDAFQAGQACKFNWKALKRLRDEAAAKEKAEREAQAKAEMEAAKAPSLDDLLDLLAAT